ncbi:MAG: DMT family transporter [Anaerolineales bacterium]
MADSKRKPLSKRLSGILLVITATICWATSGIFINLIIRQSGLSPVGLAFWRDLTTSLLLLAGILVFKPSLLVIKNKDLPWLIGMGSISIGVFHIFWNKAVVMLGASLATVVQCNAPIFVTIMAWFLFGERITIRKVIAVVLAAVGTVLVSGISGVNQWKIVPLGLLIALGSAITYGSLSLFGKKLRGDYSAWTILFYCFVFASLTLFIVQLGRPDPWPVGSNILPLFTGFILFSTIVGFALYTTSLDYLPASVASITATSEILFASILAYIVLQERMDLWQILGAVLIIIGVILVSLAKENTSGES